MKRLILAGVLLLALAMAMTPIQGAYTATDRELVSIDGGLLFLDESIAGALNYDNGNVTLPWKVGDFDHTNTKICIHATDAVNITGGFWNNRGFASLEMTAGQWANETITVAISNGFDVNLTYSHINLTANNTDWEATVYYYLDDVEVITDLITFEETDVNDPDVAKSWTVNDTLTFGTMPMEMICYLMVDYPSTVVSDDPDLYPWNGTLVDTAEVLYVEYQKYGPFHDIDENDVDITAGTGTVTVEFESNDEMEDATWTIDPTDDIWGGAFDGIDMDTLAIEVNGDEYDDWEAGSIVMDNLDIDEGDNEFVFTWTASTGTGGTGGTGGTEPTTDVWTQEAVTGVPNWALAAIAFIVVIALIAIYKNEKK